MLKTKKIFMKRVLILIGASGVLLAAFCLHRSPMLDAPDSNTPSPNAVATTKNASIAKNMKIAELEKSLSPNHLKGIYEMNDAQLDAMLHWFERMDQTKNASVEEIRFVEEKVAILAPDFPTDKRKLILKGINSDSSTSDILVELRLQSSYYEVPNVCISIGDYFYAWRKGTIFQGDIISKKDFSRMSWRKIGTSVEVR